MASCTLDPRIRPECLVDGVCASSRKGGRAHSIAGWHPAGAAYHERAPRAAVPRHRRASGYACAQTASAAARASATLAEGVTCVGATSGMRASTLRVPRSMSPDICCCICGSSVPTFAEMFDELPGWSRCPDHRRPHSRPAQTPLAFTKRFGNAVHPTKAAAAEARYRRARSSRWPGPTVRDVRWPRIWVPSHRRPDAER